MKKLILLALTALTLFVTQLPVQAQVHQLKTTSGRLVAYGKIATVTTTDSVVHVHDSLVIADNSAGILEFTVVGSASTGEGITGKQAYRYKKISGTLTLSSPVDIVAKTTDTGLTTATYTISKTASENVQLSIKGKHQVSIKWRTVISPFYP